MDTDAENPASKEIYKMGIAKMLIEKSITYYQTRFRNNHLVYDKFAEFSDFMKMLQEIYDQEVNNLVKADFIRLRKNMPRPPRIEPNEFWHALCMQCFSYSFHVQAKSKNESRESIKHTKDCPFEKEFTTAHEKQKDDLILDFIHFVEPKTK